MIQKTSLRRVLFARTRLAVIGLFVLATLVSQAIVIFSNRSQKVEAATSSTLNFQARLLSATGSLVPDGYYNIEFKLYNVSSGGSALWTETLYDQNGGTAGLDYRVRVANGYFSVYLGDTTNGGTAFPGTIDWDQELWLTMNVGGSTQTATPTWDGEMNPRLKLTAVPYAFKSAVSANVESADTNAASTNSNNVSITSGNAAGATSNSGNITIDSGTATQTTGQLLFGTNNASALTIGRAGVTTTLQGSVSLTGAGTALSVTNNAQIGGTLAVTSTSTFTGRLTANGGITIPSLGDAFINSGSTIYSATNISDVAGGGDIGTAAATVDVATTFNINQTTTAQTLTLPTPTTATAGRIVFVNNVGTASFTMYGSVIATGKSNAFIWNGTTWVTTVSLSGSVVNVVGTLDGAPGGKSADGAVIDTNAVYLQTADGTYPGLVSTTTQTFAGAKTFSGNLAVSGSSTFTVGTGLTTLGGGLDVSAGNSTFAGNLVVENTGYLATNRAADFSTTGTTDDANLGNASLVRLTGASAQTITGITGGADGRILTIINAASQSAILTNNDSGSTAANRIITGTGGNLTLEAGVTITLVYDSGASLWRVTGSTATSTAYANTALSNLTSTSINQSLIANANNTLDLGSSGTAWRSVYAGTSVLTPLVDTISAGTLSIGTSTATAITIGDTGVTTTNAGALTVAELLTGQLGATISGATISLNDSSNFNTSINGGTSTGTVTIGNSAAGNISVQSGGTVSVLGTTTINTTGTATTSIGNSSATTTIAASSLLLNTATISRTASGTTTIDLVDGTNTTLALLNSGAGVANLTVDGAITVSGQLTVGAADTTGTLLVVDTKTDTGDPSGTDGAIYYNSFLGKFRCYEDGAWKDCVGAPALPDATATYRDSINGITSGNSINVDPSTLTYEDGDVLVLFAWGYTSLGAPSGSDIAWTERASDTQTRAAQTLIHKVWTATADPSITSFTLANGETDQIGYMLVSVSGASTNSPVDAVGADSNLFSVVNNPTAPSITTTTTDALLLVGAGVYPNSDGTSSFTPPAGMTEREDAETWDSYSVASQGLSSAGATGAKAFTEAPALSSVNDGWIASSIAIRSASSEYALNDLSNLTFTAINASLIANANNTIDLGSSANAWRSVYAGTSVLTSAVDTISAGALSIGNSNATSVSICNSAACDTITIGTNTDADTITVGDANDTIGLNGALTVLGATTINTTGTATTSIGNATGSLTLTGSSASTFVLNGITVDATEFNRLDGHDAALVDVNDAVSTAIVGTGALDSGSITANFGSIDTGADNITTSGTVQGGTVNATSVIQLNGTDINTAGTLTNVAYENQANVFTQANNFQGNLIVQNTGYLATQRAADFSTTGTTNDANLGAASLVRLTGVSAQTITGITGGADGRILTIINAAGQAAVLTNNDSGSTAANRIITGSGGNLTLEAGASITMVYDSGASVWRVTGSSASTTGFANTALSNLVSTSINQSLIANANNTLDLGSSGTAWRSVYAATSVLTPLVDTVSAGTLSIGTSTATAITIGDTGVTTTNAGALTVSELLTGSLGATISGAAISLNDSSNFNTSINGGTSTGTVTIGNGVAGNIGVQSGGTISLTGTTNVNTTSTAASSIGNATGSLTLTGSSASTFVLNGITVDATEFNRLDGHDAALVDVNDAVTTAIVGTGALDSGSITANFGSIDTGADNITTTGTVQGTTSVLTSAIDRVTAGTLTIGATTANAITLGQNTTISGTSTFTSGTGLVLLQGNTDIAATASFATRQGTTYTTAGSANDVAVSTASLYILDTSGAAQTLTGIVAGRDGQYLTLVNADTSSAVTLNNEDAASSANNRIITGTGGAVTIPAGGSMNLIYDSTNSRWRVIGSAATSGGYANTALSNLTSTSINQSLIANANNTLDLGSSGTAWRSVYAATSVLTPAIDTISAGALAIGNTTATSVSICNSATCDTITLGSNADADTITVGDSLDTVGINGTLTVSGASTFQNTMTFSGVATDITTGANETLTIVPNGTGDVLISGDNDTNLQVTGTLTDDLGGGNIKGLQEISVTLGDDGGADYVAGLKVSATSANTGNPDALIGIFVDHLANSYANVGENALSIGTGWEIDQSFLSSSARVAIADVLRFTDQASSPSGGNTLLSIDLNGTVGDVGITGALQVNGNTTTGGTLTVQGASATIGSTTQAGSLIIHENTNNNTVTINTGTQATGSFAVSFPTLAANDVFCLVTAGNCGSSTDDSITVNSTAATDANFLNTTATATVSGITWSLNTGSNPDDITLDIAAATGTTAGTITANAQTFGGDKTFNGLLTGALGATISGAAINLNASSNFATNINTGTSTGAVSIGNSAAGAISVQSASTIGLTGTTTVTGLTTGVALTVNNSTSTGNVLQAQDNGTNVLVVADGGNLGVKTGTNSISSAYDITIGEGAGRTIGVLTRTTNAVGNALTISAGNAGAGGSAFSGGLITIQGGAAAGTGNANGGGVAITGGAGTGTGVLGLVSLAPTYFLSSGSPQSIATDTTLTGVDTYSTISVDATNPNLTATVPVPNATNQVVGRIIYVTAASTTEDFTLALANTSGIPSSYTEIGMKANNTATLVWNGFAWTAAGASSSTDLQSAYNNTLTSAGGAEIVLAEDGGAVDGFTIRNNPTNPIVGGIFEAQSSIGTNLFSVNNLADEYAANGGAENSTTFTTNWTTLGTSTITQNTTSGQFATGIASVNVAAGTTAGNGVRQNLATNPATNTVYMISFTAMLASGSPAFTDLRVDYTPTGASSGTQCAASQTIVSSGWTRITCEVTTPATAVTNADVLIYQVAGTGSARTWYIDNFSMTLADDAGVIPNNVQIGGGIYGGAPVLFTLDRSSGPPVANGNETYLGSMYYDTVSGRIQCYESDGWGACGSAPNNYVNLVPEYPGSVLNGSGVGTMTANFCANESVPSVVLAVNTSFCAEGESKNYYQWTSPQATMQTYSIYITYQLPAAFKNFESDSTVTLTARTSSTTDGSVTYEMFRNEGGEIEACGTATTVTTSNNTWQTVGINGNESTTCGFSSASADDFVIFKINVNARNNANVYASTLSFTTVGQ